MFSLEFFYVCSQDKRYIFPAELNNFMDPEVSEKVTAFSRSESFPKIAKRRNQQPACPREAESQAKLLL